MIFTDKLTERSNIIVGEFDKLLEIAWERQSHKGDLLLWDIIEPGLFLKKIRV